eukprot:1020254-Lingulodinium_polyedra.AAC.1
MAVGTVVGVYGAVCGVPPIAQLSDLRRAARRAAMRGVGRAAPEAVLGFLSPCWRLGPYAACAIKPVTQA